MGQSTTARKLVPITDQLRKAFRQYQEGRLETACRACEEVLGEQPNHPAAIHLLGLIAARKGEPEEALRLLRRSVRLAPGVAEFHSNLGTVLGQMGKEHEAVQAIREAIRLQPNFAPAHRNLGMALTRCGRIDEAVEAFREVLLLDPSDQQTICDLRALFSKVGDAREEMACLRRLAAMRPNDARLHSDLVLLMHYLPNVSVEEVFHETVKWARRFGRPLYPKGGATYPNDLSPDRPLRVGYVSGDFRNHPVGRFALPLIESHDAGHVEVTCYSDAMDSDEITRATRSAANHWCETSDLNDQQLAEKVQEDRIDVLVDLTGHMQMTRLLMFAHKPAPVQVTYLGHPNTTGLETIDCRITDALHDPTGKSDELNVERLARLPRPLWCYRPLGDEALPVTPSPSADGRPVMFGCMNRISKLTPEMMRLWAGMLHQVPGARLRILVEPGTGSSVVTRLARHGIDPRSLDISHRGSRREYLENFSRIDLHLDTFPYNGATTTFDGLWMGVPTVTLAGDTHVQRVGLAVLSTLGLQELVGRTPNDYARIAVELACNRTRLTGMRWTLRPRLQASPLMDGKGLAAAVERLYRDLWRQWCRTKGDDS